MFTSFDISICTSHKLAANTHRSQLFATKRIQMECFGLKNHQTVLVHLKSFRCKSKSLYFSTAHPHFRSSIEFTQRISIQILKRTFTFYFHRCRIVNTDVQLVHENKRSAIKFANIQNE